MKNFVIFGLMVFGLLVGGGYTSAETKVTIFNRTDGQMYVFWGDTMISLKSGKSKTPSPVEPEKFFVFKDSIAMKKTRMGVVIHGSLGQITSVRESFFLNDYYNEVNWVFFEEDGKILNNYYYIHRDTEKEEEEEK